MTVSLVRLDDRLLHGQVVVGWGQALGIDLFILVDDRVRDNAWERDLFSMGLPPGVRVEFASVGEAVRSLPEWMRGRGKVLIVAGDLETLARLCDKAPQIRKINIGGLHQQPGRTERLRYVYLTDDEAQQLAALSAAGVDVTAQDVPTAKPVRLAELL